MKESSIASGLIVGGAGALTFSVVALLLSITNVFTVGPINSIPGSESIIPIVISLAFTIIGMRLTRRSLRSREYTKPSVVVEFISLLIFGRLVSVILAGLNTLLF